MGPSCLILLQHPPCSIALDAYLRCIGDVANSSNQNNWNFWVKPDQLIHRPQEDEGCQFTLSILAGTKDYSEDELRQIAACIGYEPACMLLLYAGCNGRIDHLLLAEIALAILNSHQGCIDFTGDLLLNEKDTTLSAHIGHHVFGITYMIEKETHFYHIADAEFLQAWMKNSRFSMIK